MKIEQIKSILLTENEEYYKKNKYMLIINIRLVIASFFDIIRTAPDYEIDIASNNILKLFDKLNINEINTIYNIFKKQIRSLENKNRISEDLKELLNFLLDYLSKRKDYLEKDKEDKISRHRFDLCYSIIFKKRDLEFVRTLLINKKGVSLVKDKNGRTIFELIIDEYLNTDRRRIKDINYYEEVINYFYSHDRENTDNIFHDKILPSIQSSGDKLRLQNLRDNIMSSSIEEKINELCERHKISFKMHESIIEEMKGFTLDNSSRYNIDIPFFTIDSEGATFLDDAFAIEERTDGSYYLYIAIADIPSFIQFNSLTYDEAIRRCETLYLNGCTNEMYHFPKIKRNLSLDVGRKRNAIVYRFPVDSNFNIDSDNMMVLKSRIKISQNLTFSDVNHESNIILPQNIDMINKSEYIASKLKSSNPDKDDYRKIEHIVSSNDDYHHSNFAHDKRSARIIEEFMLLVGRSIAEFADREGWIYIYRNLVYPKDFNYSGIMSIINNPNKLNEETIKYIRDNILCAYYDLENKGHDGLGYTSYSHSTSPGRRAIDGLNQYLLYQEHFNRIKENDYYNLEEYMKSVVEYINERKRENLAFTEEYNYLVGQVRRRKK